MAEGPLIVPFRFEVQLFSADGGPGNPLCGGAFSEVSGLEATMSPKKITEGGRNWGEIQRVGPTTFGTVTLRRGMTSLPDLYEWFDLVTRRGEHWLRLHCRIDVHGSMTAGIVMSWHLQEVLPVKFKGPDLDAVSTRVAIEELQLVHEGLTLVRPGENP